jgi:hypothetical protein
MALFCIAPDINIAAEMMNNTVSGFDCIIADNASPDFVIKPSFIFRKYLIKVLKTKQIS